MMNNNRAEIKNKSSSQLVYYPPAFTSQIQTPLKAIGPPQAE